MYHRIHAACNHIFIIMRGNSNVMLVEFGCKRMLRFPDWTIVAVNSHNVHYIIRQFSLRFDRAGLFKERSIDNITFFANCMNQRNKCAAELFKIYIKHFFRRTALKFVKPVIICIRFRWNICRYFSVVFDNLRKIRFKNGIIVRIFCFNPSIMGFCQEHLERGVFIHGDFAHLIKLARFFLDFTASYKVQFIKIWHHGVYNFKLLLIYGQFVDNFT